MAKRKAKKKNPRRRQATARDVEKARDSAKKQAVTMTLLVPIKVLHDKFGYGKKRLEKFADEYLITVNDWAEGRFTSDDLAEWVKDYIGLEIQESEI